MNGPAHVLVVGESAASEALDERLDDAVTLDGVSDAAAARDFLADHRPDCVATVYDLPGSDGLSLADWVGERYPDLPVVLIAPDRAGLARQAIDVGVAEYVSADAGPGRLADSVRDAVDAGRETRALRHGNARLGAFFENLPDPAIEYAFDGEDPIIRAVNRAFTETFGYDRAAVRGEHIDDVIVPDGREGEAERLTDRAREGERVDAELRRETTDGVRAFRFRNVAVDGGPGGPDGYALYVDVTEQTDRERRLQRQNERLDEFASVVSHDLRNPMGAAKHRIELARQTGDDAHLDEALDALDGMNDLLRELLDLARRGEHVGSTEPVSLADAAETAWEQVATGDASLSVAADRRIDADRGRLVQLLSNLFVNAVEHSSPDRAAVTVTVGTEDALLYVADDGQGIPPEKRADVFRTGYTTDSGGTGYGLTIVRQVAQAHGWEVGVTASADGGARFEFRGVEFADDR